MPDSCKTISECDKIANPWTKMKTIDWREISLATGLAALTSHVPPAPTRTAILKHGLLHACLWLQRSYPVPGLCGRSKAYLLLTASRRRGRGEPQGWLSCYSDRWTRRELRLPASPLPGSKFIPGNGRALFLFSPGRSDWNLSPAPTSLQS